MDGKTHGTTSGLLMARLSGHLEGDIVRGVALNLDGGRRQVVEVLVEELGIEPLAKLRATEVDKNWRFRNGELQGRCTYVVGRLRDVRESRYRHLDGRKR
jgi:hypothetical protein